MPVLKDFIALFLSFFSVFSLSLPFAFHILSDCGKKLGVFYRQSWKLDQHQLLVDNGPFYYHFDIFELFFCNKIPLSRRDAYVMDWSVA